jgi:hypothetical protein
MLILIHVIIALSSIGFTTYLAISPSQAKLRLSYVLVALTLVTGTYLVVSTGSNLLKSCLTGLVYLAVVTAGIVAARHRLAPTE